MINLHQSAFTEGASYKIALTSKEALTSASCLQSQIGGEVSLYNSGEAAVVLDVSCKVYNQYLQDIERKQTAFQTLADYYIVESTPN